MLVKNIIDEDFVNYKKPSMYIAFPYCNWKCCSKNPTLCHNYSIREQPNIEISSQEIVKRYLQNPITKSFVFSGFEPFESALDIYELVSIIRARTLDDIVIYTGFYKDEIKDYINKLKYNSNIIIKYGRYVPNQQPHYDEVLGVNLASDLQYAEKIS